MSVMEGSLVYGDRIRLLWATQMMGNIFHIDFLEKKIVGFDKNATTDR